METTVFQIVGAPDLVAFVSQTILAAVILGVLISLINMASSRD